MKVITLLAVALAVALSMGSPALLAKEASESKSGESLFKEHCSPCHPNGGNVLNPQKTLLRRDREANNIKTEEDIVRKMRNPGPFPTHPQGWASMKMFDEKTISNEDALKIANYILKTFE